MSAHLDPAPLITSLGIDPSTPIDEAITHASFVNEHPGTVDYERLEFLGDSVLGLCVSELLLESVPRASEGKLTRMRAALVNTEFLTAFARSINLASYVRLGRGATHDALRHKVLADVVEALVAAVYLHGGLDAARALTRRIVGESTIHPSQLDARDPKSLLQEKYQRAGGNAPAPVYRVVAEGTDADRWFEVEVEIDGQPRGRGRGRSKKAAEFDAARVALETSDKAPEQEEPK